jgi:SGNH domain (fused to AT3 domains)
MAAQVAYNAFFSDHHYTQSHDLIHLEHHECNFYDIEKSAPRPEGIAAHCYTPHSHKVVLLWGDSHVQHLHYGLSRALGRDVSLLQMGASGCPPHLDDVTSDPLQTCNKANRFVWQQLKTLKPTIVILAQQRGHENNQYDAIIQRLKSIGIRHVVLVGPVPQWQPVLYKILLRQYWQHFPNRLASHLEPAIFKTDQWLRQHYQHRQDVRYISLVKPLCNAQGCLTSFNGDYTEGLITYDYGHFTLPASDYIVQTAILPVIRSWL